MAKKALIGLMLGLVLAPFAWAQQMATVKGTVEDTNGAPLPGVQVRISTQMAVTDENGAFSMEVLPGTYEMTVSLQGFSLVEREVTVKPTGLQLEVTMTVAVQETVTVTGSFIPSQIIEEGPAPISVIDAAQYQKRGSPDFEEIIRTIPEMYGHSNVANQYTASTYNIGMRAVNLRNLGAQRNLVLLNGRRSIFNPVSVEPGGAVDVSVFPRIALKRIEILKEASPLYGSDAISGVFNYITDDRFTGIKAEVGYTDIKHSDGGDRYAGFMKGWEKGPLNMIVAIEYSERNKVRIWDEDWYRDRNDGSGDWLIGSSPIGSPGGFLGLGPTGQVDTGALDPACGSGFAATGATSFVHPLTFTAGLPSCGFYYTQFTNFIEPQERINIFGNFTLRVNDQQEMYGQLVYSYNDARYTPSPTYPPTNPGAWPLNGAPSAYIPPSNPGLQDFLSTLPPDQRIKWAAGALYWGRPLGMAGTYTFDGKLTQEWARRQQTWQALGGVRGEWGDGPTAVHYDFAGSFGSLTGQIEGDDILVDRWAAANHGFGGPDCNPETGTPGVAPCYYWNPFFTGFTSADPALRNRADVFDWMNVQTGSKQQYDEAHFYADFSGSTSLELGGGPLAWAAGYEYTYNRSTLVADSYSYTDDVFEETPFTFLWLVLPFGDPNPVTTDSHAAYAEVNLPFAKTFELDLAARYTDVPFLSTNYTKGRAMARWTPIEQLVLRASFSQGLIIPSPWQTDRWDRYVSNIGGSYIPIEVVPAKDTGGLEAEEADSINFGFVLHPVPQVTLSTDYWKINFTHPIARETPGFVVENYPDRVELNTLGQPARVYTHTVNGPDLDVEGYDFSFNWDIGAGSTGIFSVGFDGTLLNKYYFSASEALGTPAFDALGQTNGRYGQSPLLIYSTPKLKYNVHAGWQMGRHSLNFLYNYVDGYKTELLGSDRIPTLSPPYNRVDSWSTYDAYYSFRVPSWHTTFQLSVYNLTDEAPPVLYDELAYDAMTHNPLGRMVKLGVVYQF